MLNTLRLFPILLFIILVGYCEPAKAIEIKSQKIMHDLFSNTSEVFCVALSNDAKNALSNGPNNRLILWDLISGSLARIYEGHSNGSNAAAFSSDGQLVLSATMDYIKVWNRDTGSEIGTLKGTSSFSGLEPIRFSRNGKFVAAVTNSSIDLWEISSGSLVRTFQTSPAGVRLSFNSFEFVPDANSLMGGAWESDGVSIKRWDISTGKEEMSIKLPAGYFVSTFSKDCRFAVLQGGMGKTEVPLLWDLKRNKKVRSFKCNKFGYCPNFLFANAITRDNKYLLSGFLDRELTLWNMSKEEPIKVFQKHQDSILSASISAEGNLIISGGLDSTTRLWRVKDGKEIVKMIAFKNSEWIVVTPEGYYNSSANGDKEIVIEHPDKLEKYPLRNFRETFFRPDLVKSALSGVALDGYIKITDIPELRGGLQKK